MRLKFDPLQSIQINLYYGHIWEPNCPVLPKGTTVFPPIIFVQQRAIGTLINLGLGFYCRDDEQR